MANRSHTVRLHYVEHGQGTPVLLLHGFPLDHTIWQAQIAALAGAYRVIAPDLRGHGRSPAPEGTYHMDLLAGDVIALLDQLSIERAVWVGHSMGGYVAMAALRVALERVMAVGLVATHPHADSPDKRQQRLQSAEAALARGCADLAASMMGVLFSPQVDPQSPLAQAIYPIMLNTSPQGVAGALRGMADRPDSLATLRDAGVPVAVVAGEDDQIVTADVTRHLAQAIPAWLVVIPHAGHLPMVEQPAVTTNALREFLESSGGR